MTQMKNFLAQFKSWAHWFAGVAVSGWMIYATVPEVHAAVNSALASHPKIAGLLGSLTSIFLAYSKSQRSSNQ